MQNNEDFIIISLITDKIYLSKVHKKIKNEYFEEYLPKSIFPYIKHCMNIDASLSYDAIIMLINGDSSKDEDQKKDLLNYIENIKKQAINIDLTILLEQTEHWAKYRSFFNAIYESMKLIEKNNKDDTQYKKASMIMETGMNVNFHDEDDYSMTWNNNADRIKRIRSLKMENSIFTGFKPFDDVTGGMKKRTITCFLSPTNQGKTLSMSFLSSCLAYQGLNVAIATLEISCDEWLGRVDANLLDISTYDMSTMDENDIMKQFEKFDSNNPMGTIEIRQFSEANVVDIKMWLKDLYNDKKYVPDILVIDYIGIMSPLYIKDRANTYINLKEISWEVRQKIGVELDLPILSAAQSNRGVEHKIKEHGKEIEMTNADVGDSYAVPQNLDSFIAQVEIKEGVEQYLTNDITSLYLWKKIKSRNHVPTGTKTMVGVSKNKQRLYDINFGNMDITMTNIDAKIENEFMDGQKASEDWLNSDFKIL